jgi:hypothetical protein
LRDEPGHCPKRRASGRVSGIASLATENWGLRAIEQTKDQTSCLQRFRPLKRVPPRPEIAQSKISFSS